MSDIQPARVVIVGAGFAGLACALGLRRSGYDVTVLDRNNYHLFQPLLYQVATGFLDYGDVAAPLRTLLRPEDGIHFRCAEVASLDIGSRCVVLGPDRIPYDHLVIAVGTRTNFHGLEAVPGQVYDLKELPDAIRLHDHLVDTLEEAHGCRDGEKRRELLTFAIVGGGPTGTEFAGALADLAAGTLRREYPEIRPEELHILLLQSGDTLLPGFPERLQQYATATLHQRRVAVVTGVRVTGWDQGHIHLDDRSISAATILWAAGVTPPGWLTTLDLPRNDRHQLVVGEDFRIPGHPEIFAVGDIAARSVGPLPQVAPAAMQGGAHVARTLVALRRGGDPGPFRYRDRGNMAVVGRFSAVADVKGLGQHWTGPLAWLAWLGLHLYFLIGFRNRLSALVNWGFDYLVRPHAVNWVSLTIRRAMHR